MIHYLKSYWRTITFPIAILAVVVSINACGNFNRSVAQLTGYTEIVVDGVVYLQFPSGVTVKYNPDGSICTKK